LAAVVVVAVVVVIVEISVAAVDQGDPLLWDELLVE
jgi:hypothetical protein